MFSAPIYALPSPLHKDGGAWKVLPGVGSLECEASSSSLPPCPYKGNAMLLGRKVGWGGRHSSPTPSTRHTKLQSNVCHTIFSLFQCVPFAGENV